MELSNGDIIGNTVGDNDNHENGDVSASNGVNGVHNDDHVVCHAEVAGNLIHFSFKYTKFIHYITIMATTLKANNNKLTITFLYSLYIMYYY